MPTFAYSGRTRAGQTVSGVRSAETVDGAVAGLRREQILVTRITPAKAKAETGTAKVRVGKIGKKASAKSLAVFTRQFSVMIDAGLPLVQCLEILGSQEEDRNFAAVILQTRSDVEAGASLADAMRKHPKTFDPLFTNMIAAGEAGGILDMILKRLATYIEKSVKLTRQVKSAMTYPIAVMLIAATVVGVILWKVIPTFAQMFEGLGASLPLPTRIVIAMSNQLVSSFPYLLVGVVAAVYGFRRFYASDSGRRAVDGAMLRLPVLGDILRKIAVARFCRTLATLVSSGVPILDGLEITAKTAGNAIVEDAVMATRKSIERGETIAVPLKETAVFPPMVTQMIGVGEATGALDTMLAKIAEFYEEEVDSAVAGLLTLLEPIMIAVLGVIVGGIVIAMYLPIFDLISKLTWGASPHGGTGRNRGMTDGQLRRKLGWLIAIRAVVSTVLLGGAIVAQIRAPGSLPVDPFFFLIALTYGLTIAYALTARHVDRHRWLLDVQLAGDALTVSAFIYFTGGITSFFPVLYVLPIVAASTLQMRRGGLLVAALSALIYTGLVVVQYMTAAGLLYDPWLAANRLFLPPRSVAQYTVALNVFGFFAVALLSGSLAENARSAGARLRQASTELADLQAFNQHVIDSLPSGLATTDPSRCVLTFNQAARVITGLSSESVVGRELSDVLQLSPALVEALDHGLRAGSARRLEFPFSRPDGTGTIDIGLSATHLETPSGRAGFLVTFQDVTEVKKLERTARIQQRLAAVGEMAAGIAHEIRNPLASMSGSIQILRHELPLSSEQAQLMDIVLRESERLNTTIRSFLAYARPQRFAIARFDVGRVLNDTALLLRNSAEVREGHSVEVSLPSEELLFEADEGQIRQIVWNLATNGLRAMPEGGRLELAASFDPVSGGVVLRVEDEGVGIPPEDLDGIFQPFHGGFERGSGLGLAIVHRIVTDYHGEVQVSSRPGKGTRVSVSLPVRAEVTA